MKRTEVLLLKERETMTSARTNQLEDLSTQPLGVFFDIFSLDIKLLQDTNTI